MKKYYKENKEVRRPKVLIYEGEVYNNPSDEQLLFFGYTIAEDKNDSPENRKIQRETRR